MRKEFKKKRKKNRKIIRRETLTKQKGEETLA